MNWKCRIRGHDWRVVHGESSPTPEEEHRDSLLLWWHNSACQRCHEKRRQAVRRRKEEYIPAEGVPAVVYEEYSTDDIGRTTPKHTVIPTWPPGASEAEAQEYKKTCVRPGTREMGVMRDGSHPPRQSCRHQYHQHGEVRYYGDDRYGFNSRPCRDCSCEGFLG
jgi:hypothetical protein